MENKKKATQLYTWHDGVCVILAIWTGFSLLLSLLIVCGVIK